MRACIEGVSIWGPGLEGWAASRPILSGEQPYVARESPPPPAAVLSAIERRRAGVVTRLALAVAREAVAMSALPAAGLRSVFGSASGDGIVIHAILEALANGDPVSPTQFHNSVHNSPAGYWSIGTSSAQPVSCLGCHDDTFAAALLKAMAEVRVERVPVLLCVYDVPLPTPLDAKYKIAAPFGVGLVLSPVDGGTDAPLVSVEYEASPPLSGPEAPRESGLRTLSRTVPAARALRLLESLARGVPDAFALAFLDGRLDVHLDPCSTVSRFSA
ncbi:MAG: beta-ketoacyl synthase chain length factor [Acetobacteraceae bacterium]